MLLPSVFLKSHLFTFLTSLLRTSSPLEIILLRFNIYSKKSCIPLEYMYSAVSKRYRYENMCITLFDNQIKDYIKELFQTVKLCISGHS